MGASVQDKLRDFWKQSTHYKLLVLFIIAASLARILVCFYFNPMSSLQSDMMRHWMNGALFPRNGYTGAGDPIGYQIYIFVLHNLTADNRFLVALASALMSIAMPWTYYRAARNFGMDKIPSLWVWLLIAWTPSLVTIYHFIMMETLLLLLEGVALWTTARYLRKGTTKAFLWFIVCWTLACLTKPTVAPLAAICGLWSWWKKRPSIKDLALAAVIAIVMLVPPAVHSKVTLGFVAPFGNPWLTKLMLRSGAKLTYVHYYFHSSTLDPMGTQPKDANLVFSSPSCDPAALAPLSSWAMRRASGNSIARFVVNSAYGERDWKAGYERYNHDSNEWLAQWRENIILFLFSPSWPEAYYDGRFTVVERTFRWLWAPLILLVLVLNFREFAHRRFDLIPVAVTLFTLLLAFQNEVLMEGRYRKPVEPLLLLNLVWVIGRKADEPRQTEARLP